MRIFRLLVPLFVAALLIAVPTPSTAQIYVSFAAPPLLPQYEQPPAYQPNTIWTPGYWARGPAGYYWVPGTWVPAPSPGLLWTPGYWGWGNSQNAYVWNQGYWGRNVGYYGGVNYGAGYYGNGYVGGGWYGNTFRYNTAVTRVNPAVIRNVYVNRTVIVRNVNRYSYNGPGGIRTAPTAAQLAASRQQRIAATALQRQHAAEAAADRRQLESVNHGKPPETAVARPLNPANRPAQMKPMNLPKPAPKPATKPAPAKPAAAKPAAAKPAPAKPATKPATMAMPPAKTAPAKGAPAKAAPAKPAPKPTPKKKPPTLAP